MDYDNNQRITRLTDGNGNTVSATYNDRGLLETYTDARGLVHRLSYLDDAPIVSRMVAETTNRKGENLTVLFERGTAGSGTGGSGGGTGGQAKTGGLLNFTTSDWLGRKQTITTSIAENNQSVQVTENGATATTTLEEGVGTVDGVVNQVGERTTVEHENYGLVTRIRGADGASRQITMDGLGQLREIHQKGVRTTRVHRDNQGRVSRVRTPQRQVEVSYDESAQAISRMTGGRYPVEYRDFNHLGQAQMVDVNDGMLQIKLEYFDGGALRCLTETRMGQLPNQYHYNSLGDLIEIKRAHQKPVNFSYNNWGSVDTMTYGDRSYSVFGSGGEQKMSLPGDVSADVDERGRLKEILRPGLALKELTYDAADRLDQVIIGGVILRDYDYRDGKLDRLQVVAANGGFDLYRYQFDEDGRLTAIQRNGEPYVSWTYPDLQTLRQASTNAYADPDRMLTYTDPNGVEHRYTYDRHGYIRQIDLTDGPSFHYTYDGAGNLLRLQSMGLSITYENWQRGMPQAMTWGDGTRFEITRDGADNLDTITSNDGVYLLDLDWEDQPGGEGCGAGSTHQKELKRITRQAGTFREVLEPDYDTDNHLTETRITRTDNGQTTTITEQYGPVTNQLLAGLTRILDGTVIVEEQMILDETADRRRIASAAGTAGQPNQTGTDTYTYDEALGNLTRIERRDGTIRTFVWDGFRRLREIRDNNTILASYDYDNQYRRVRATSSQTTKPLAYAYQNSKVIAIGQIEATGDVYWTHAIGQGPLGPAFLRDLTGSGHSYYIFCDHLGTPLAYKNTETEEIYITPHSPWGERLANDPTRGPPTAYPNQQFKTPPDAVFPTVPLSLAGHLHDEDTGLINMHHRFYSPQLGHFLNPDFRAPNIYDPTAFTEPYAYAAGNPMMFWDEDGLKSITFNVRSTNYGMSFSDEEWTAMVLEFANMKKVVPDYKIGDTKHDLVMLNHVQYEEYEREFSRKSNELEALLIETFKENAHRIASKITASTVNEIESLSSYERAKLYSHLNSSGVLALMGEELVGRGIALEAAGHLVSHEVDFYLNYQLSKDLEVAGNIELAGGLAGIAASSAARASNKLFTSLIGKIRNTGLPKINFTYQPAPVLIDEFGNIYPTGFGRMNISFSQGARKRLNVGSAGHHVPAVRKAKSRPFSVDRSDKTRPTLHFRGSDPGYDHWRLHDAERNVIGPRQGSFPGTDRELFDAYRDAYKSLEDIRVDVYSPNGEILLGENVSPAEAVELIQRWLIKKGLWRF